MLDEQEQQALWDGLLAQRERAMRVARARCSSQSDAEDCVQEALARVAAMPEVNLDRLGSLVSTVVANLAVDSHRARTRAARAQLRLGHEPAPTPPEELVCDVHEAQWLRSRFERLAPRDRAAMELRAQGLPLPEIASRLGVSYKAAENALGRARASLRAAWRATAAAIGILVGRPDERGRQGVALTPVALVLVCATAALVGTHRGPGPDAPLGTPTPPRAQAADVARALPISPLRKSTRQRPVDRPAPAAARPPTQPVREPLVSQPVAVPAIVSAEPYVTQERTDESFLQSTRRCLQEGLVLTPSRIGCPP